MPFGEIAAAVKIASEVVTAAKVTEGVYKALDEGELIEAIGNAAKSVVESKLINSLGDAAHKIKLPDASGAPKYTMKLPDAMNLKPPEIAEIKKPADSESTAKRKLIDANDRTGFSNGSGVERVGKVQEGDYPSTYKERLDQTPNETGERGQWDGKRGESMFIPNDKEMQGMLSRFGLDGIFYQNAIPDFSKCAACTVEIDNMTENRKGGGGNFDQCDHKCADQWSQECKDGKSDWTANDVRKWREENGYSWHERNDMKTCDLIPTKINDYFGHLGGVGECRRRDAMAPGGEFDE